MSNENMKTVALEPEFIKKYVAYQVVTVPQATQENPTVLAPEDGGEPLYLYVDWILGYVVHIHDVVEHEGEANTADLNFYYFSGEVYHKAEGEGASPLPLPVTMDALLNFYPLLKKRDEKVFRKDLDKYVIEEPRDSLSRHISISLNEEENGLIVTYSALKDMQLISLGRTNLPLHDTKDNHEWVYYKQEFLMEEALQEELLKDESLKEEPNTDFKSESKE